MPSLSRLSGARGAVLAVGSVVAGEHRGRGRVVLAEQVGLADPVGGGRGARSRPDRTARTLERLLGLAPSCRPGAGRAPAGRRRRRPAAPAVPVARVRRRLPGDPERVLRDRAQHVALPRGFVGGDDRGLHLALGGRRRCGSAAASCAGGGAACPAVSRPRQPCVEIGHRAGRSGPRSGAARTRPPRSAP